MIILDEQLADQQIVQALSRWYQGDVIPLSGPKGSSAGLSDELIPRLLLRRKHPMFVTINTKDFWLRVDGHEKYAIICLPMAQDQQVATRVPELVRRFLKHPQFVGKKNRCGRVFRVSDNDIRYYFRMSDEPTVVEWLAGHRR